MTDPETGPRINLLIIASALGIGGTETVIRHLAEAIDKRRFNVTVCVLKWIGPIGDELARSGIDIVNIVTERGRVDYLTFVKVLKLIRARRIEVVHTHTPHGLVDAGICKLLKPGLRIVHTFHFGNYPHTRPRIIWMERIFSRLADRLFAVGEMQRRQLRAVFKFADRSIGTVWNGVKRPSGAGERDLRREVGACDRILIGTIATLIPQKGLPDLLRTARIVKEAGHDVKFVIVGEGRMRHELELLRSELGLEDVVTFTGWIMNAGDVALPAFDVFFQPSKWEAMSVVLLEAMAAGVPIVATRVGESPRIIEDGVDGLLADPGDVPGMAAQICRLIGDAGLRERLGRAASRKVDEHFTVEHMARAYERVYLETVGAGAR